MSDRDFVEALAQLNKDSKKQTLKGLGVLILFLVVCGGFLGGALWAAGKVNQEIKPTWTP